MLFLSDALLVFDVPVVTAFLLLSEVVLLVLAFLPVDVELPVPEAFLALLVLLFLELLLLLVVIEWPPINV